MVHSIKPHGWMSGAAVMVGWLFLQRLNLLLERMTPDHQPASCQVAGALGWKFGIWICRCCHAPSGRFRNGVAILLGPVHGQFDFGALAFPSGRMIGLPDAENLTLNQETWELACLAAEERRVDDEDLSPLSEFFQKQGGGTASTSFPSWQASRPQCSSTLTTRSSSIGNRASHVAATRWRSPSVQTLGPHSSSVCFLLEQHGHEQPQLGCRDS